jgi:hypothetical protein
VRLEAIPILFAAFGLTLAAAWADGPFSRGAAGSHIGYIVPERYAEDYKADLIASIPSLVKIDGFWTPPEQDVAVADRVLRDLLHAAVKDPTLLFPDLAPNPDPAVPVNPEAARMLEQERDELDLVSRHYDTYVRQYVGIIVDGQKLVFCNYSDGTKVDPSTDYIFIHKVFVPDGGIHFLQCRFDPIGKTCSNVSMIGSWQEGKEKF